MPFGVGGDDLAGRGLPHSRSNQLQRLIQVSSTRQIDAWSAARAVEMVVGEAGDDGLAAEVDDPRARSNQLPDLSHRTDRGESSVGNRRGFGHGKGRVDSQDPGIEKN